MSQDSTDTASGVSAEPAIGEVYAEYERLRAEQPVSRSEDGLWMVARYEDVRHVLKSHGDYSSRVSQRMDDDPDTPPSMLFSDPPEHDRLRALVSSAFTPRRIAEQEKQIEARCETLMDDLTNSEHCDLVSALAAPLPVGVIATMLGVEDGDFTQFKRWSDAIFTNIGEILIGTPSDEAIAANEEMSAYFLERITELRRSPQEHLLSDLVYVETEQGRLSDAELLMFCRLLLIAGNETTTSLIVSAARVFSELPAIFARLQSSPELIPRFVEETLRYHSPFKATMRRTTRDVELAGEKICAGELVLPLIASANRDERFFDRAAAFEADRDPNPHLAFGLGIHVCLGAPLARLEGRIAIKAMLRHLDSISLDSPDSPELDQFGAPTSVMVTLQKRVHSAT